MFQIERWLGFFGRLCTNRTHVEPSMNMLYDILLFSYTCGGEAADSERVGEDEEEHEAGEDKAEREFVLARMLLGRDGLTHGRRHLGVRVSDRAITSGAYRELSGSDLVAVRRRLRTVRAAAHRLAAGKELHAGVDVHGTVRTTLYTLQQARAKRDVKVYTTAFCFLPLSALSPDVRLAVGENVADNTSTVVGVDRFWFPSEVGSTCVLARIHVYRVAKDPTYGLPTLSLTDHEVDWVRAEHLGDVVAIGPGNGGYGTWRRRWTVLPLPGGGSYGS